MGPEEGRAFLLVTGRRGMVVSYWLAEAAGGKPRFLLVQAWIMVSYCLHIVKKRKSSFLWSQAWTVIPYWLADVMEGKPRFPLERKGSRCFCGRRHETAISYWLLMWWKRSRDFYWSQAWTGSFLLATWCNGKEFAISIGQSHELWFPIGYLMKRKSRFLLVAGMNREFPIGYLM